MSRNRTLRNTRNTRKMIEAIEQQNLTMTIDGIREEDLKNLLLCGFVAIFGWDCFGWLASFYDHMPLGMPSFIVIGIQILMAVTIFVSVLCAIIFVGLCLTKD